MRCVGARGRAEGALGRPSHFLAALEVARAEAQHVARSAGQVRAAVHCPAPADPTTAHSRTAHARWLVRASESAVTASVLALRRVRFRDRGAPRTGACAGRWSGPGSGRAPARDESIRHAPPRAQTCSSARFTRRCEPRHATALAKRARILAPRRPPPRSAARRLCARTRDRLRCAAHCSVGRSVTWSALKRGSLLMGRSNEASRSALMLDWCSVSQ